MSSISLENIRITADSCNVDFKQARRLAEQVILGMIRSPRLIAWFDGKRDKDRSLKDSDAKALLAERDSGIRVDVNNNQYSFLFTDSD